MRVSADEKKRSRSRIIASAARLFRSKGIERTAVADVMNDAGLTHGGFYRHFDTKDALMDCALATAFEEMVETIETALAGAQPQTPDQLFRDFYLRDDHVQHPALGCPVAALGGEIARAPGETRTAFSVGVRAMLSVIARGQDGHADQAKAARTLATAVGAIIIARASDEATADMILAACREP